MATNKGIWKGWKPLAIIFICITFALLYLIISFNAYSLKMYDEKESCSQYCAINYDSFKFDYNTEMCDCYKGTNLEESKSMKDLSKSEMAQIQIDWLNSGDR